MRFSSKGWNWLRDVIDFCEARDREGLQPSLHRVSDPAKIFETICPFTFVNIHHILKNVWKRQTTTAVIF